jgi:hypothetical protein
VCLHTLGADAGEPSCLHAHAQYSIGTFPRFPCTSGLRYAHAFVGSTWVPSYCGMPLFAAGSGRACRRWWALPAHRDGPPHCYVLKQPKCGPMRAVQSAVTLLRCSRTGHGHRISRIVSAGMQRDSAQQVRCRTCMPLHCHELSPVSVCALYLITVSVVHTRVGVHCAAVFRIIQHTQVGGWYVKSWV